MLRRVHSIRYKLLMVVMATTLTALLVVAVAMVWYDARTYQRAWVGDLMTQADILGLSSSAALTFDDRKAAEENLSVLKLRPQIAVAALYTARGALFAQYARDTGVDAAVPKLPGVDGYEVRGDEITVFKRIVSNGDIAGTVYLRARYELFERVKSYISILGAVLVLSLIVAFGLSSWLNSVVTKPILAITDLTRRVRETRDFSLRASRTTEDEVGYLAEGFNDMLAEIGQREKVMEEANRSLAQEVDERLAAEGAVRAAELELQRLNSELEHRVVQRTAELQAANKEMETFSYSVSHDLRAPVRAIAGFSRMLAEDHGAQLGQEGMRKLDIVQAEAKRMGALIDDLLAFSRLGRKTLDHAALDMGAIVRSLVERAQAERAAEPAEVRIGTLPTARGDRSLIEQVWANLISNAFKYSGKRDKPVIEVAAISEERDFVYFVRDNGAGFDPRYKAKLFGVFQRLHDGSEFPGTGVGLALVQRIVLRHGGRVWADGEPDRGATFYFTLPKESVNDGH